jgi:hypothetical protein
LGQTQSDYIDQMITKVNELDTSIKYKRVIRD